MASSARRGQELGILVLHPRAKMHRTVMLSPAMKIPQDSQALFRVCWQHWEWGSVKESCKKWHVAWWLHSAVLQVSVDRAARCWGGRLH